MTELSMFANMAEILGVLIVIGGVYFAVLQMRQIRQQRRELAAIELFRFFASPKVYGSLQDCSAFAGRHERSRYKNQESEN